MDCVRARVDLMFHAPEIFNFARIAFDKQERTHFPYFVRYVKHNLNDVIMLSFQHYFLILRCGDAFICACRKEKKQKLEKMNNNER